MILCDTNIFIEFYKSNQIVLDELTKIGVENLAISVITKAELYYGARNKQELVAIRGHLQTCHCLGIGEKECTVFLKLMETYSLSHKASIPDMLIAAISISHNLPLYTLNIKDFIFIPNIRIYHT